MGMKPGSRFENGWNLENLTVSFMQGQPTTFFVCKVTVRKSKFCLEISKVREGLKMSG